MFSAYFGTASKEKKERAIEGTRTAPTNSDTTRAFGSEGAVSLRRGSGMSRECTTRPPREAVALVSATVKRCNPARPAALG